MRVCCKVSIIQRGKSGEVIGSSHSYGDGSHSTAYRSTYDDQLLEIEARGLPSQGETQNSDACRELLNYFLDSGQPWKSYKVISDLGAKAERGVDAIFRSGSVYREAQIIKAAVDERRYHTLGRAPHRLHTKNSTTELAMELSKSILKKSTRRDPRMWLILDSLETPELCNAPVVAQFQSSFDTSWELWERIWLVGRAADLVYRLK